MDSQNVERPKLGFREKINNEAAAFVPKLIQKPHSLEPLALVLEKNFLGEEEYRHPYKFELESFEPDSKFFILTGTDCLVPKVSKVPCITITSEEGLKMLIDVASTKSVIGVDLQVHSYRSYQGITCLIMISTDDRDYIVDTFPLWDKLQPLNEVFCNPQIVKVFHGADGDVASLQRDFGLYIVNMFDNYEAAKILSFPNLSSASLYQRYSSMIVDDKPFQRADWRIRPLPPTMSDYASENAHRLLYVYERLKRNLMEKGGIDLMSGVWDKCRLICLKRYTIPRLTPQSHLEIYNRSKQVSNQQQLSTLQELVAWRDQVAREEDESTRFVLPDGLMIRIAQELPKNIQDLLSSLRTIPPLVQQRMDQLQQIIEQHRPVFTMIPSSSASYKLFVEETLNCVHDLKEMRDLPTLIGCPSSAPKPSSHQPSNLQAAIKTVPSIPVLASNLMVKKSNPLPATEITSPYARYVATHGP